MSMEYLDGALLKKALKNAAVHLESNKQKVNALNVFPVPDGDTGTNMTLTILAAVEETNKVKDEYICEVAQRCASGSLMGARGNSGVILSQLFRGFSKGIGKKTKINGKELAESLKLGYETAIKAVMKPVEGTILTVAREAAQAAVETSQKTSDILVIMEKCVEKANETLRRTPDMLSVLKEAGVVDAGGQGLLHILQGAFEGLKGDIDTQKIRIKEKAELEEPQLPESVPLQQDLQYIYCTEMILKCNNLEIDDVRAYLQNQGDSIVVAGMDELLKIHIHTNNPGAVIEYFTSLGELQKIKIDNMKLQHETFLTKNDESEIEEKYSEQIKRYGIVAVASGEGFKDILLSLGADTVIEGGQTMNPSTEDILKAMEKLTAEHVIILPNNGNIILAANQAKEISKRSVEVIPTKTIPQGIAALLCFNPDSSPLDNQKCMSEMLSAVKTGQITFAVRSSAYNGHKIEEGDIIGLLDGEIKAVGKCVDDVSVKLLETIVDDQDEIITIYYGAEVANDQAQKIAKTISSVFPLCEIELHYGGQPIYYYIFSVE